MLFVPETGILRQSDGVGPIFSKNVREKQDMMKSSYGRAYTTARPSRQKKMIVNPMIKRVDVYRNYELNVELNMNIRRFFLGMEETKNIPITA